MISNLGNGTTPVRAIPGVFNGHSINPNASATSNNAATVNGNGDAYINGTEKKEDISMGSVSNPSPTTPSCIPLPVPIPSMEEHIATLSYNLGISRSETPNGSRLRSEMPNRSVPGVPTKGTLNRGVRDGGEGENSDVGGGGEDRKGGWGCGEEGYCVCGCGF
ncbi:hypothetical protein M422DRAFT_50059 [Sphaerobolus stellatus SS14]|uniref:Uncharacterized protein n=1 Tax=Sphaerobolus stellatus (strain SS14) TaxID=990650 RepID=A0A0C9UTW6_SPHS4|nr:hypothetical protein M422DRAFT_50059 [Sphaerobolus stellatus SS14]